MVEAGGSESEDNSPAGAASKVFISYASQDVPVADMVCAALETAGLPCWIAPRDVRPGESYAAAIVQAINSCRMLVLVLSKSAIDSPHVLREVERASSKKRPVLSVRMDATPLPPELEYFLSANHWLDASIGPIEQILPALIDAVQGQVAAAHVSAPRPGSGAADSAHAGAQRDPLHSSGGPTSRRASRSGANRILIPVTAAIGLALTYFVADKFWLSKHTKTEQASAPLGSGPEIAAPARTAISEKSIAVLPFVDLSEKKDQEYFSDGLSEELIDLLAQTPDLQVIARTSSFYFKGKQVTIAEIAKTLGVAHVLEGSVRKSGTTLRVTAQLIRADTDVHLWSKTYDRDVKDIFKVQDELAAAVVEALKSKLLPARQLESGHRTDNSEAYDQYLYGKQSFNRSSPDGDRLAVLAYRRAIAFDVNFAAAYAGLAEAEAVLADTETGERAALQRALEAADRAVALAPEAPYGYAVRSWLRSEFFWDWSGARADIEKAIAHDAGDGRVQLTYSELLRSLGLIPEAIAAARKATDADPLSEAAWGNLGYVLMNDRQFAEARQAQNRAQQINPESIWPPYHLAQIALLDGHPEMALAIAQTNRTPAIVTAMAAYSLGRREESQRALNELISRHAQNLAYQIAEAYAWSGETDQAFEWLDRSYAQHDGGLSFVKTDLFLGRIRADRRFAAMLRRMNLPE
jgi:TolB-like protein/tetratricopeptide (TPR) repeat protein